MGQERAGAGRGPSPMERLQPLWTLLTMPCFVMACVGDALDSEPVPCFVMACVGDALDSEPVPCFVMACVGDALDSHGLRLCQDTCAPLSSPHAMACGLNFQTGGLVLWAIVSLEAWKVGFGRAEMSVHKKIEWKMQSMRLAEK